MNLMTHATASMSGAEPLDVSLEVPDTAASSHPAQARAVFAVCVTTMNRAQTLAVCLDGLTRCTPRPELIVVSDDSPDPARREANQEVAARHAGVVYLEGPHRGVCANRNNAVKYCLAHARQCTHVSFVDDDILVDSSFFATAQQYLRDLPLDRRGTTILSGAASSGPGVHECHPLQLSFAGYFREGARAECVNIHAAVFPLGFFDRERWDENIFFGTEDAELSLRALRRGYTIDLAPQMRAVDTMPGGGVLTAAGERTGLTRYQVSCEAARLYIGVKRYGVIEPNFFKCVAFVSLYFAHMLVYLTRRRALSQLVPIVRISNVWRVFAARQSIAGREDN